LKNLKLTEPEDAGSGSGLVDTYKGSKYNQLAISDIQIIGKAK